MLGGPPSDDRRHGSRPDSVRARSHRDGAAEKDGAWIELKSPNFTVVCNAGESAARQTAKEFEQIRSVFAKLLFKVDTGRPFLIVAAKDEGTMKSLAPSYWAQKRGIRWTSVGESDAVRDFVVLRVDASPADPDRYTLAYWSYAASVVAFSHPGLPLWAQRGLADFYAHTTVQEDRVLIGRAAPERIRVLRERALVPIETLLAADRLSPYYTQADKLEVFDATAWALVHYLMMGDKGAHRERLSRFMEIAGTEKDPLATARAALGDLRQLATALGSYVHSVGFYMVPVPTSIDVSSRTFVARKLSAAEVLSVRGALHVAMRRFTDAKAVLEEAARLDPELPSVHESLALLALDQKELGEARRHVQDALKLDASSAVARRVQEWLEGSVRGGRVFMGADTSPAAVVSLAQLACDQGDLKTCEALGDLLIRGVGGDKEKVDQKTGVAILTRVCEAGVADACGRLAYAFDKGERLPADLAQAAAFEDKACTAGDTKGCLIAATRYEAGRGVDADAARAVRLYETACSRGNVDACSRAGFLLHEGRVVPKDEARAAGLHTKACDAGSSASCGALGFLYLFGTGVPRDVPRAIPLLEKACDAGQMGSCSGLGSLYLSGQGVPRNRSRAVELFEKACKGGYQPACHQRQRMRPSMR